MAIFFFSFSLIYVCIYVCKDARHVFVRVSSRGCIYTGVFAKAKSTVMYFFFFCCYCCCEGNALQCVVCSVCMYIVDE